MMEVSPSPLRYLREKDNVCSNYRMIIVVVGYSTIFYYKDLKTMINH